MSFRDFDQGLTADQIRKQKQQETDYRRLQQEEQKNRELLERFKESEHRLSILRTIQGGDNQEPEERLKQWLLALKSNFQ